jgi:Cys-tRNA synthase (O-phospho-L-seryl-tRNA:Cys-tRNA synthase)
MENKRASFDGRRRTSVASESSLKHEYAPTMEDGNALYSPQEADEAKNLDTATIAQNTTSDILDDMEKFQREIDELRERYQKGS